MILEKVRTEQEQIIRKKRGEDKHTALRIEAADLSSREYRRRWASLIKKIYEIDPLVCPDCGGHMKIISFIQDSQVIDEILNHLGLIDERVHSPPQKAVSTEVTYEPFYDDLPIWE